MVRLNDYPSRDNEQERYNMNLHSTTKEHIQIVKVEDARIDSAVALAFKNSMRSETDRSARKVILDLGSVDFVDSSGLGAIVASMKALGSGRKMILAGLTPTVEKVFRLTRMDSVFPIYPSLDEALKSLEK